MAKLVRKAKGDSYMNGKPRVLFTCHKDDFLSTFEKICNDIWKASDCAIYHTEDLNEEINKDSLDLELGQMNLFVVPVTYKLLTGPNRAMDVDIVYAKKEGIPVLPVIFDMGIEELYSQKLGELQFLNPFAWDETEISYEDKLKKYLDSVLIGDKMLKRIRSAFDAYIFLSYRKKDRKYANELMGLIHKNPECRDIAIWYDEFLTPGESFTENINRALTDSKLFALLVTPSILEEPEGKPNFIMREEYPLAKKTGIEILPAEMEKTDTGELKARFESIPVCVNPRDDKAFRDRLITSVKKMAIATSNNEPEHTFLIGLAYLDGIDVEFNRQRGMELITLSAEAGLIEAMEKLFDIYSRVRIDLKEALKWARKLYEHYSQNNGDYDPLTLASLRRLTLCYVNIGDYKRALELGELSCDLHSRALGDEATETLFAKGVIAMIYTRLREHKKALELNLELYAIRCRVNGENHPHTIALLGEIAKNYTALGERKKALAYNEMAYSLQKIIYGNKHLNTLVALGSLALSYDSLEEYDKALSLENEAYELFCKAVGYEHPHTLTTLGNMARTYANMEEYEKALMLGEEAYSSLCKVVGETHPDTIRVLGTLITVCEGLGDKRALELNEKEYAILAKKYGEDSYDAIMSLTCLVHSYIWHGENERALPLAKKAYELRKQQLGNEHFDTLTSLSNVAYIYMRLGDYAKAMEAEKEVYTLLCNTLGKEHPNTLASLRKLLMLYSKLG